MLAKMTIFAKNMDTGNIEKEFRRIEALFQVRAFARQDGALLGLIWIISFAALIFMPQSMLNSLLMMATPFIVGWRLIKFRNYALGGSISFKRALVYCLYSFFYASLILAVSQMLYFSYLDNGRFADMLNSTISQALPVYKAYGVNTRQLTDAVATITSLSALEIAFMFMLQNLCIGFFLSMPIALIGKKRNKNEKQ